MPSTNWIFVLIEFTNILINLDHGIMPACTQQLTEHFQIGQTELGILGSIVYLGIIVTGSFVGRLYQKYNSKKVCLVGLIGMILTLLLFVLVPTIYAAMLSRFMTGGFQVFMLVYFPVWIDKFGGDKATTWITLLQIGVPLGIFIGYGLTSVAVHVATWQWSFYAQVALILVCLSAFLTIKHPKLDVKETVSHELEVEQHLMIRDGKVKKKPTYGQLLCILLKTKMYLIAILTMSVMLFVSTGIQFWMTNYFIEVLHFTRTSVNIAYAIVSITGPTSGCAFGGYVINSIGGYHEPKSIYFIWLFSAIGIGAGVVIPFVSTFYVSSILLWIVLFFGGAMVPGLTGMIMSSVQPQMRSFGNSKGEMIKNTLGYFPSPFLYGLVNHFSSNPRAGITLIMFWGLWAPILLGIGSLWTFRLGKKALEPTNDVTTQSDSDINSPLRGKNTLFDESPEKLQEPSMARIQHVESYQPPEAPAVQAEATQASIPTEN